VGKAASSPLDDRAHHFGHIRFVAFFDATARRKHVAAYTRQALDNYEAKTVQLHLNVLYDIFKTATAEELVEANPVEGAERPKTRRKRWRILQPAEVARVLKAFTDEQARTMFLVLMLTGVQRFELRQLRWRDVSLVENVLRVAESKTDEGERTIALSPMLADALADHYRRTAYKGDDDFVFCHPERGTKIREQVYAEQFRAALKAAGITDYVRPFHDARHASLTNGAAAGEAPIALMTRAGHRSMSTTRGYLHLAGVVFRDEADALERRLLGDREDDGDVGTTLYPSEPTSPDLSEPEARKEARS
jgi:integrase